MLIYNVSTEVIIYTFSLVASIRILPISLRKLSSIYAANVNTIGFYCLLLSKTWLILKYKKYFYLIHCLHSQNCARMPRKIDFVESTTII